MGVSDSSRNNSAGGQAPGSWLNSLVLCWHEPRVHDYDLYYLLNRINIFVMLPICLVGLLVNGTALICLYRPPKITSGVFVYLKALLILDMVQLLVTTLTYIVPPVCDHSHNKTDLFYPPCFLFWRFLELPLPRLATSVNTMHSWTIAALSAHRYWKIARPVVSRFNDTLGRARCVLLLLVVGVIAFRLPLFIVELRFVSQPMPKIKRYTWATIEMSWYRFVYHSILDPLLAHVAPLLMMSVFSLLTLLEICRSRDFGYHKLKIDSIINGKNGNAGGGDGQNGVLVTNGMEFAPLSACFKRRRSNGARQKQEIRATVSIVLIVVLHLALHSIDLLSVVRKWDLLISSVCAVRADYLIRHVGIILSLVSASINAFVFIAFTNRLKSYVEMLIRKTSRNLSSSSDPAHSPRVTTLEATCLFDVEEARKYNDTPL
uniref:G-protein coupled receptors family 1 profile domain-containing protein n=1 Tax=Plectus sambesii TaxID=2011161 RepID=A0A914VMK1_9BILA